MLHNTTLMPPRLFLALALSFVLHGGLLVPDILKRLSVAPPRPALQAALRLPPTLPLPETPFEPLLKNTLDAEEVPKIAKPPASAPQQVSNKNAAARRDVQLAKRKLSTTQFYPTQAVERGIEGDVRLILKLSADGSVEEVSVAASSGYPILDNAAIKAAYAMGRLTGVSARELILPVSFRLE